MKQPFSSFSFHGWGWLQSAPCGPISRISWSPAAARASLLGRDWRMPSASAPSALWHPPAPLSAPVHLLYTCTINGVSPAESWCHGVHSRPSEHCPGWCFTLHFARGSGEDAKGPNKLLLTPVNSVGLHRWNNPHGSESLCRAGTGESSTLFMPPKFPAISVIFFCAFLTQGEQSHLHSGSVRARETELILWGHDCASTRVIPHSLCVRGLESLECGEEGWNSPTHCSPHQLHRSALQIWIQLFALSGFPCCSL